MTRRRLARATWAALFCAAEVAYDLAEDVSVSVAAFSEDVRAGLEDIAADTRAAWRSV